MLARTGRTILGNTKMRKRRLPQKLPRTSPKRRNLNLKRSQNQKNLPKWKDGPEPPFKPRDKLRKRKKRRSQ